MPNANEDRKLTEDEVNKLLRRVNPFPVVRGEYYRAGEQAALETAREISFNSLTQAFFFPEEYGRLLLYAALVEPKFNELDETDPEVLDHQVGGYATGFATGLVDAMRERETEEDQTIRKKLEAINECVAWVTHQPSYMTKQPVICLWIWPKEPELLKLLDAYDSEGYIIFCLGFSSWGEVFRLVETFQLKDQPQT